MPIVTSRARCARLAVPVVCALAILTSGAPLAQAQTKVTAQVRPATPPWNNGLQPISAESYYHAIECGTQGGANPACVFWDTDMCKNGDFTLAWYSAYKQVAYEVWTAVQRKQPPPQPNYQEAQRTRVTIAITPVAAAKNPLADFRVTRGGTPALAVERSLSGGGGRFTFDYPAFAPTAPVTLEMVGKQRTVTCVLPTAVLRQLR